MERAPWPEPTANDSRAKTSWRSADFKASMSQRSRESWCAGAKGDDPRSGERGYTPLVEDVGVGPVRSVRLSLPDHDIVAHVCAFLAIDDRGERGFAYFIDGVPRAANLDGL